MGDYQSGGQRGNEELSHYMNRAARDMPDGAPRMGEPPEGKRPA